MKRLVPVCALAAILAACNGEPAGERQLPADGDSPPVVAPPRDLAVPDGVGDSDGLADSAAAPATPEPPPQSTPSPPPERRDGPRAEAEETPDFLFEYSWPAPAGAIEPLAALLDRRLDRARRDLARESAAAHRRAREDGFPYNKHSHTAEWKVVADLPGWLSLSNDIATYSGGAHGMYTRESLLWDKANGVALGGKDLFVSPAALEEALGTRFCDALDRERERRRGDRLDSMAGDDTFNGCPGIDELEIFIGSSNRRTFNRITLYAGPYVAGPYVEGAYEVNLPVDRALRDAVKPEYRDSFTARN